MPVLKKKKHRKHGAFIRVMRKPFPHARLEETRIEEDTPAAFYYEATRSGFSDCEKARRGSTGQDVHRFLVDHE